MRHLPRRKVAGKRVLLALRKADANHNSKDIPVIILKFKRKILAEKQLREFTEFAKKHKLTRNGKVIIPTLDAAKRNVSFLTPQEIEHYIEGAVLALKAAHVGRITYHGWVMLNTSLQVAYGIEHSAPVKGMLPFLDPAAKAITSIEARCDFERVWTPAACKGAELFVLAEMLAAHKFQLANCTVQEITSVASRLKRQSLAQGRSTDPRAHFNAVLSIAALKKNYQDVPVHIPNLIETRA